MATSKTLTPTNVTIQIPAFTDKPDQRVNSNCIDKEADAINALSDQIGTLNSKITNVTTTTVTAATGITISTNSVRKLGRLVEVLLKAEGITPSSNGWITLGTLPNDDAYKPITTIDFAGVNNSDDSMVHIRIDGRDVEVYGRNGVLVVPRFFVTFISKA